MAMLAEKIVLLNCKEHRQNVKGVKYGRFYYESSKGNFISTNAYYVDCASLRNFFDLWDVLPNFDIVVPPHSEWYDADGNNVARICISGEEEEVLLV